MKILSILVLSCLLITSCSSNSKSRLPANNEDPNLEVEGQTTSVNRQACIDHGGQVSQEDKRYFVCSGGKYNGVITSGPISFRSCGEETARVQKMVLEDGSVENEDDFLNSATLALSVCISAAQSGNWKTLMYGLTKIKKSCDQSSDQGQSSLYRGTCYLKASELGTFILGR